jgi:uncharacterized protein YdhG (YjbR/CyaY superfamily)
VDEYLAKLGDEQRAALQSLRERVWAAAPGGEECISYGLPAIRKDGRVLVAFGATKKHCALYPMSSRLVEKHSDELEGFDTSKGTIRFQPSRPLPDSLVRRLVEERIAETADSG